MHIHLGELQSYYRSGQGRGPHAWDDAHVVGWLKRMRIPPYQDALPVQPKGTPCPVCGPTIFGGVRTQVSFPGGAEMVCAGCSRVWLELDAERTAEHP
jgi:hypothetical protein